VPVELQVEGPARPLPAGLEVSAYRIAQEALTNTIKHAPGGRATVTVRYRPHTVELEVVDTGGAPGPARPAGDGGHGLRGMRERVALYGGVFEAGPYPGGFRVLAAFPTDQP
jgi:signal transduction histidine kinase